MFISMWNPMIFDRAIRGCSRLVPAFVLCRLDDDLPGLPPPAAMRIAEMPRIVIQGSRTDALFMSFRRVLQPDKL